MSFTKEEIRIKHDLQSALTYGKPIYIAVGMRDEHIHIKPSTSISGAKNSLRQARVDTGAIFRVAGVALEELYDWRNP